MRGDAWKMMVKNRTQRFGASYGRTDGEKLVGEGSIGSSAPLHPDRVYQAERRERSGLVAQETPPEQASVQEQAREGEGVHWRT